MEKFCDVDGFERLLEERSLCVSEITVRYPGSLRQSHELTHVGAKAFETQVLGRRACPHNALENFLSKACFIENWTNFKFTYYIVSVFGFR